MGSKRPSTKSSTLSVTFIESTSMFLNWPQSKLGQSCAKRGLAFMQNLHIPFEVQLKGNDNFLKDIWSKRKLAVARFKLSTF